MNKGLIFICGLALGAAAGSGVTYLVCHKKNKEEFVENHEHDHEGALVMDEDELREYYVQQLRDLGVGIYEADEDDIPEDFKSKVNPLPDDYENEEDDDEDEEEDPMDEAPVEINPNPFPYVIKEEEFDKKDDYSTETLHYYVEDETYTDEEYDILGNISDYIGRCVEDIKNAAELKLDAVYVRNEYQTCDYEILIFQDSYKHAVEGEEELGDMAD